MEFKWSTDNMKIKPKWCGYLPEIIKEHGYEGYVSNKEEWKEICEEAKEKEIK